MGGSDHVFSTQDVHRVVRMLGEISDPAQQQGMSLDAMRHRLFDELAEMIDAVGWLWLHGRRDPDGRRIMAFSSLCRFQSPEQQAGLMNAAHDDAARQAIDESVQPLFNQAVLRPSIRGHFTRLRDELIDDDRWLGGDLFRKGLMAIDLDEFMLSIYPLSTNVWSGTSFYRAQGMPRFSQRERALVHLILNNIDWLHREGSDVPANSSELIELPSRPRQVLIHLIGGDSSKQIAAKLNLSIHTIHDHLKTIYRHFDVSSRSELLAKFITTNRKQP